MIELHGTTWDHPRGLRGCEATAAAYTALHPDVRITWHVRTLQDFADASVENLADRFDLLIFDHPFIGHAARAGWLLPLDEHVEPEYLADQANNSVGRSHASYAYGGHQWALAADAACQVSAYRPDLLERLAARLPETWDDVLDLARRARSLEAYVAVPLIPVDSLMCLYSLCANAGAPPGRSPDRFVERVAGRHALDYLAKLQRLSHPMSRRWNPPQVLEAMATGDEIVYCPLAFGYNNYARPGFRANLVRFADIPSSGRGPVGAILGGAGVGVSSRTAHPEAACAYAAYMASGPVQRTNYVAGGGQPGHRSAWLDPEANRLTQDFFRDTLATIDGSYLRPRHPGYMAFQDHAFTVVFDHLDSGAPPDHTLDTLDHLYRTSRPAAT
jgi:multiple sugar transport system substrate-binding protein